MARPEEENVGEETNIGEMINNETKVSGDIQKIMRYVKDDLFFRVIDVYDENQFKVNSYLYNDFMSRGKTVVTGLPRDGLMDTNKKAYMKYLWTRIGSKKSYKVWLAMKRSNAYQAVQDRFFRECD